jgi:hypothetical protein
MKANKHNIFLIVSILSYSTTLRLIIIKQDFIPASIAVIVTLTIFNLAHFSSHSKYKSYIIATSSIACIILIIGLIQQGIGPHILYISSASIILHAAYLLYIRSKKVYKQDILRVNTREFVTTGTYIFSILMSASISIITVGILRNLPFNCETIYQVAHQQTHKDEQSHTKQIITKNDLKQIENNQDITKILEQLTNDIKYTIKDYQEQFLTPILNERKTLSIQICEQIYQNIQSKFAKPEVQLATMVPLFLLLSPIIAIIMYIVSAISLIAIFMGKKIGIYKMKIVSKQGKERE